MFTAVVFREVNPFRGPEALPIPTSSKFVRQKGFHHVNIRIYHTRALRDVLHVRIRMDPAYLVSVPFLRLGYVRKYKKRFIALLINNCFLYFFADSMI